ncbi:MAG TPA: GNAT family N-acetyltransferase [Nitrospira sp.]|nr:GNAT family N-acetyltransferase [Nitrospira sp.]
MNALTIHRIGNWCYQRRIPVIPQLAYGAIYLLCRAVIPMSVEFGEGTELAYGGLGIVLHERTRIGRYVSIGHDVTIGGRSRRWGVPVVGDRCVIGAGAKLLGPISVGESSVIGANAVVLDDVPPNCVMAGMPAKIVREGIDIHDYSCLQPPEEGDRLSFRTSNNLLITVIEDAGRLSHLVDEWTELLENSGQDCLFLTPEWLTTWWRCFERDEWTLRLMTVRRQRELLAIAPFFSRPRTFGRLLSHQSTEFLGTGVIGSDYLDLIVRRGEERMVHIGLAEYLNKEKPPLILSHLPARSSEADGVVKELEVSGWQVKHRLIESCPYITLRGHTWESYLDSLGANHRYNFMRRLKNLQKVGVVEFDAVEKEDQRREALQAFMALHAVAWRHRGGSQAMQTTRELAFHEAFSRSALERGWLRLFLLRVNGRPVGALYGFRRGARFYFYQSGFDPGWRKHSVGLVTMGLAIKHALAEGVEEYDLLHGTEAYKFHWAKEMRDLSRIHLFPPSWRGWLYRAAFEAESQGKQAARRWMPQAMLDRLMKFRMGA